jgi:hypothetical protein
MFANDILQKPMYCYAFGVTGIYLRIILNHSIFQIWIFDPESRIITGISVLDLRSRLVNRLVISSLLDLSIKQSMTAIKPITSKMCIIFNTPMVVEALWLMVTAYRQQT